MTATVLINVNPFMFEQKAYLIKGDEIIAIDSVKMKNLAEDIFMLSEKHDTREIHLSGAKVFTKGLKQKIEKSEIEKYSINKLNITLI